MFNWFSSNTEDKKEVECPIKRAKWRIDYPGRAKYWDAQGGPGSRSYSEYVEGNAGLVGDLMLKVEELEKRIKEIE